MKHLGSKTLETQRLILRRFTLEDAPAMYRNWANDPQVTQFLTWPSHPDEATSRAVLRDWVSHENEPDYYAWAIVPRQLGEPIGSIAVVSRNDDLQLVHIGYCIGRRWWRQGYTSEALAEVIRFFFEEVGVNRVESRHDPNNPNSGRVMAHCGMTREGTMRQADRNNQGVCDYTMYSILASEYRAQKR